MIIWLVMMCCSLLLAIWISHCVSLSSFVWNVDAGNVCDVCEQKKCCFAHKKLFEDSNWVSEFMLVTYFRLQNSCPHLYRPSRKSRIYFCMLNTMLVAILFWSKGFNVSSIVFGVSTTMLLALSVVDWNTQYIPVEYTLVILICGLIRLFADYSNWVDYVIGLFAVSGFLLLVDKVATPIIAKRYNGEEIPTAVGDGDIKLMAATGLLIGWKLNFLAVGIGCILGSIIHLVRMKIKGSGAQLALGPYLSLGVYITMICGEQLISWYLNMLGVAPY